MWSHVPLHGFSKKREHVVSHHYATQNIFFLKALDYRRNPSFHWLFSLKWVVNVWRCTCSGWTKDNWKFEFLYANKTWFKTCHWIIYLTKKQHKMVWPDFHSTKVNVIKHNLIWHVLSLFFLYYKDMVFLITRPLLKKGDKTADSINTCARSPAPPPPHKGTYFV